MSLMKPFGFKRFLATFALFHNTEDYLDHKILVIQKKKTADNTNLIADISKGNIQILANQSESSTTSRTSKEDLIKAIDISISKVLLKDAEYVSELW